jgi:hypothetical protein
MVQDFILPEWAMDARINPHASQSRHSGIASNRPQFIKSDRRDLFDVAASWAMACR